MRRLFASLLGLVLLIIGMLGVPAAVAAQDATPGGTPPPGLTIPDPADCTVEPKPISFFEQMAASPPAVPPDADQRFSRPSDEQRPWTMPAGEPVDGETTAAVTDVLHEALACLNANDPLRFLALFSDDMVTIFFALQPLPPEAIPQMAATPVASPPDMWLGYLELHDLRMLPDGRVAGLGENWDPTEPPYGMGTDFAIFVKVGDRWLIDSLIENVVITGEATPAA